jgi:hypothetical protein
MLGCQRLTELCSGVESVVTQTEARKRFCSRKANEYPGGTTFRLNPVIYGFNPSFGIVGIGTPRGTGPDGYPFRIYVLNDHNNVITRANNLLSEDCRIQ